MCVMGSGRGWVPFPVSGIPTLWFWVQTSRLPKRCTGILRPDGSRPSLHTGIHPAHELWVVWLFLHPGLSTLLPLLLRTPGKTPLPQMT